MSDTRRLLVGNRFNTMFERGCIVVSEPDSDGCFTALDSDGIECQYIDKMVISVEEGTEPV